LGGDASDANGNTISSAGITNTYDFENHMLSHGTVTMLYDGDGNRVAETVRHHHQVSGVAKRGNDSSSSGFVLGCLGAHPNHSFFQGGHRR
jgi:hypothetical protein